MYALMYAYSIIDYIILEKVETHTSIMKFRLYFASLSKRE